jgi:hypothetical protein
VPPAGEAGAVTVPRNGLNQIPLRPSAHKTTLAVTAPRRVKEDQYFHVTAQARSRAGVPRGACVFFRIDPDSLVTRMKRQARGGRCTAFLKVTNRREVRFSVHFYGYRGWRFPTASTGPISVQPR